MELWTMIVSNLQLVKYSNGILTPENVDEYIPVEKSV